MTATQKQPRGAKCYPGIYPGLKRIYLKEYGREYDVCPKGHVYTPDNTITNGIGRVCRTCKRARDAARRARTNSPEVFSAIEGSKALLEAILAYYERHHRRAA